MKLCKKIIMEHLPGEILFSGSHIQHSITYNYHNNIGPAYIRYDNSFDIRNVHFVNNCFYFDLPILTFFSTHVSANWMVKTHFMSSHSLYERLFYIKDLYGKQKIKDVKKVLITDQEAIESTKQAIDYTNRFVQYLGDNNIVHLNLIKGECYV